MPANNHNRVKFTLCATVAALALLAACSQSMPPSASMPNDMSNGMSAGAVYALTNEASGNQVAAFRASENGALTAIGAYPTGGMGGQLDEMDGLDPLLAEDAIVPVDDRWLLVVNPGSDTITSFRINDDFSLTAISTAPSGGKGPLSIAEHDGLVYVANADADGRFTGPPDQTGNISGFRLDDTGRLMPLANSTRALGVRPSDLEFSPDGDQLLVSGVNAGSAMLQGAPGNAEIASFSVGQDGALSARATGQAISTQRGNTQRRNLPTAIGFEIVERGADQVVVVTEAREFLSTGTPGMPPMFQTGSVSTWKLENGGGFTALSQDVLTGPETGGPTSACWLVLSPDGNTVFVTSASGAVISTYGLSEDGHVRLMESRAAAGAPAMPNAANPLANADGFIDIARSDDGRTIYQLLGLRGRINVYRTGADGHSLTAGPPSAGLLPMHAIAGIAFVGR